MSDKPVFVYAATYGSTDIAWADYDVLLGVHAKKLVGTYDVAVIDRDDGRVRVHKQEQRTEHGAWGGIAVGGLVGVLFPAGVVGLAALGGVVGGLGAHFSKGLSRGDLRELGEHLMDREAALIVIGESRVREQLDKALTHADKSIQKELDADSEDFKQALDEAQKELAEQAAAQAAT
jgi:uncharacterized membrane protein